MHLKNHIFICLKYILFFILFLLFFTVRPSKLPLLKISKQDQHISVDESLLSLFHGGQQRLMASLIWIKTLLESDLEHYKENKLDNWLYLRFLQIITLDPQFIDAYRFGGVYLSIVKDDKLGAREIYDRGLKKYPDDFILLLNAGYHYFYELKVINKGILYWSKIKDHPEMPYYFIGTLSRFSAQEGNLYEAIKVLKNSFYLNRYKNLKFDYQKRVQNLTIEYDLQCLNREFQLNGEKAICNTYSPFKEIYLFNIKSKTFYSVRSWKKYRPYR